MSTPTLTWWRGPAKLDGEYTVFDAAMAERYDTAELGPEVLLDYAAITSPREAVKFVSRYGFLQVPPGATPRESTWSEVTGGQLMQLQLKAQLVRQQPGSAPEVRAGALADNLDEALAVLHASLLLPPTPAGTLAELLQRRLDALKDTRVPLRECRTCGRLFVVTHHGAQYCGPACRGTAASWRERGGMTQPRRAKAAH